MRPETNAARAAEIAALPKEDALQEAAFALCRAEGVDPHQLLWWNNGECQEPWGEAWNDAEQRLRKPAAILAASAREAALEEALKMAKALADEAPSRPFWVTFFLEFEQRIRALLTPSPAAQPEGDR